MGQGFECGESRSRWVIASMAQDDLAHRIKSFPAGKRVRNSLYIHLECIAIYDTDLALIVEKLRVHYSVGCNFNVLKADSGGHRISFLEYADFFTNPHPRLVASMTIDLARDMVGRRYYAKSINPPILHRKETLVGPKHESYPSWKAMTEEEESAGGVTKSGSRKFAVDEVRRPDTNSRDKRKKSV